MTYPKSLIGLVACVLLTACSSNQPETNTSPYTVIPFEKGVENIQEIKLSDIAEKISFIPLEMTDASLVASPKIMSIVYIDEKIMIPCTEGILAFDESGKFIKVISRKGQGPGEYVFVRCLSANEELGLLYLQDHIKMRTFKPDGTFIREYRIPTGSTFETMVVDDSLTFTAYMNSTGKRPFRLLMTNHQQDTLKAFPQYDRFEIPNGGNWLYFNQKEDYLYSYKQEVVYRDYYTDTIYTVTRDSLLPRYLLDMGKYHLPKDLRLEVAYAKGGSEMDAMLKEAENYLRPTILENDRYIVMPYTTWNLTNKDLLPELMIYDRKSKECIKVKDGAFVNDMMGNLPFQPDVRVAENVLAEWWEAPELMELAEKGVKLPDNVKNLKDDDNGVLVLVHLKKK